MFAAEVLLFVLLLSSTRADDQPPIELRHASTQQHEDFNPFHWNKHHRTRETTRLEQQPGHVRLLLKNHLVEIQGLKFNSPEYHLARWHRTARRLEALREAASSEKSRAAKRDRSFAEPSQPHSASVPVGGRVQDGTYYAEVALGTPPLTQRVMFDTGSTILWATCDCSLCPYYSTVTSLSPYSRANSSSARDISCADPQCTAMRGASPSGFSCSRDKCLFEVNYADYSGVSGPVVSDLLSFPSSSPEGRGGGKGSSGGRVVFGCGSGVSGNLQSPQGALDGLLGMGPSAESALGQLSAMGVLPFAFSFCLDSSHPSGSYATLGRGVRHQGMSSTPLLPPPTVQGKRLPYYYVGLSGIYVEGVIVEGSQGLGNVASDTGLGGVIVDSATTFTALPHKVILSLSRAISKFTPGIAPLSTDLLQFYACTLVPGRDLSSFPDIVLKFGGEKPEWRVKPSSYMISMDNWPQGDMLCLGVMAGVSPYPAAILGETWLTDTLVHVDVEQGTLDWAPFNCSTGRPRQNMGASGDVVRSNSTESGDRKGLGDGSTLDVALGALAHVQEKSGHCTSRRYSGLFVRVFALLIVTCIIQYLVGERLDR